MIDNDEFLRLVYLLAKQHFNDYGIEVDLVKHDEHDNDKPHVSFYMFEESGMSWIYSRTSGTTSDEDRVLKYGAAPYMVNKFSLEKSEKTDAIAVNKSNFELLKMLVALNKEIIEIFFKDTDGLSSEIVINEHNFEILKMLTSLNREEMELWTRLK